MASLAAPLKGAEFRSAWFGRTADVLFTKIETMPPAAPGSLGAEKHVDLLAFLMSQNQLVASDKPLPADVDQLKTMLLPGATGGPSGGLSPNAVLPPAPRVVNPLDKYTPVTDAMLQNPPAGEWPTWRRRLRRPGIQPAEADQQEPMSASCARRGAGRCRTDRTKARRSFTTACCSSMRTATKCRRIDAATGDLLWQYLAAAADGHAPSASSARSRMYGDKVYAGTSDTHIVALDAKTGRVVWDKPIADHEAGIRHDRRRDRRQRKGHRQHHRPRAGRQLHRRARRADGQRGVAVRDDCEGRRARRQHVEQRAATRNATADRCGCPAATIRRRDLAVLRRRRRRYDTGPLRNPARPAQTTICSSPIRRSPSIPIPEAVVALSASVERSVGSTTGRSHACCSGCARRRAARRHRRQAGDLRLRRREAGRLRVLVRPRRAERHHGDRSEDRRQDRSTRASCPATARR